MPKSYLHYYFFVILILLSIFKCFAIENTTSILNNDSITSPHKINISKIRYLNLSTTYNGRPKIISAYDVPNGVTLSYSPNSNVEAGTYDITVTIFYKNKIIDVQLLTQVIKKRTYDDQVRLRKPRIAYTGKEIYLEVMGPIPPNTEIVYFNEKHTNVGVYFVHAFMFNKNYKSTVFSNYLEILKIPIDRQKIIFNSLQTPYDGTVKKIELKSTLPSEIQIFQINNAHTEVGTYKVKAYLYGGRNYISTIVERTLQITGKPTSTIPTTPTIPDTSKLEFKAQEFIFVPNDPQPIKKIEITGELPKDVTVEYINNELQYPGSINPLAIIKYKDEIIDIKETTLKIESIKLPEITFPNETFEYKFDSITKKSTPYSLPMIDNLPETVQVDFIKNSQSEVGEYSVGMHASGPGYAAINNSINYEASNLTIKKAKLPPIVFRNKDFFYDGEPKSISIDTVNLPAGAFVTYLGNDQTEIGNHIVKAFINGGNNHLSQIISATMSIKFKEGSAPSLKEVAFEDLVVKYNGAPFSLYATNIPDNITVDYNITNVTDIGVYNIIATFYFENKIIDTKKATLTITKGEIDYVTFDNTSFVYDGTPKILVINGDLPEGTSVSYSRNVITDVSSISITAYINGGKNYKNKELRAKLTITKAELPHFKFDSASYVFDGTSKSIVIEGDLPNYISVSYKNNKHTNAGNHTAIANINGGRNYFDKELKATLQITKADISIVNFNDASFVYDGKPKSLKINDILPEGISIIYSYNNQINVGTYQVFALCNGNNNYNLFEVKAILTITKAELSNLTFNSASFVYDGKPKSLVLNNKLPKGTTVEYLNNKQTAPGTYEVIAKIDGGKNYNSTELKATLTINKAELPNLTFDNASFTYDGTPKSLVINDNLPDGVTITYSNNKHIDAGDYEVIAHINGGDKYNNTELKAMLTINKTKLPIIKLDAASFVYDGTPKALIINDILPEGVTLSYSNNMQINVGEYKVIAHINGGKNYENTELTAMLTIEKAELSLTYDNATFVYDGTHKTLIINDILPEGIKVTYSNNKHINSGNYEAIATVNGGINYNNVELKAHLVITKAELSNLTFDNATFVYDRLPKSLTLKGNLLDDIIVTYSNNKQTNTGVYKVTAMINGGRNYNSKELNAILTIIKAELPQVVFNSASYTYDGTQKSLILKGNIPEETTVKYINNRHTDVGVYEASAIINGGKNYYDSELKSLLVITKNELPKLTFNDASYIYDSTPKSLILKENLPEGVTVTYSNNKYTDVGVYEVTALINGGKNYNDTQLKANLTINKAELPKLTFDNATYTYDGNPKSLILTGNIPEGVTVTYSNNKYTDVGVYEVTATINGGKNYNNSQLKANLTITKAGLPKLTFDNATYTYDGNPKSLILT
ncbi:MBG domain-containing protein, partial [Myroides sp. C1519]|uniref:MBG domain-containing protein n=2 Tax=unclassified Myroides TaxID=2642485 RepID=UPI003100ABE5